MFKLILIIVMSGHSLDSGTAISSTEYRFSTKELCGKAEKYYSKSNVKSFLEQRYTPSNFNNNYTNNVNIIAKCFEE